jgi:hypothetical protein
VPNSGFESSSFGFEVESGEESDKEIGAFSAHSKKSRRT